MLARAYRFHGHGSLRYVYTNGKSIRNPYGVLKYVSNPRRNTWRAAVVVSKKVHKSAVVRNRIRRRVYEILRTTLPNDMSPTDIVFIAHTSQIATVPHEKIQQIIVSQLEKARLTTSGHDIVENKE